MSEPVVLLSRSELQDLLVGAAREAARTVLAEHRPAGYMSLESAAKFLDTTPAALAKAAQRGHVVATKNAMRRLQFRREDLEAFAQAGSA